jgi:hypothetical protein
MGSFTGPFFVGWNDCDSLGVAVLKQDKRAVCPYREHVNQKGQPPVLKQRKIL